MLMCISNAAPLLFLTGVDIWRRKPLAALTNAKNEYHQKMSKTRKTQQGKKRNYAVVNREWRHSTEMFLKGPARYIEERKGEYQVPGTI